MNIAFFISDHGFGHMMRNLPVIKEVARRGNQIILICAEKHLKIAEDYLGSGNFKYVSYCTDAGLVVFPGSLILDKEKTSEKVEQFVKEFPERIAFGKRIIEENHVDKVVVDIVPWAILAAKETGIHTYLMASFTWIEQYEGYVKEENLSVLREAFLSADHLLYYDLANQPTKELLGDGIDVGFIAREFHEDEVKRIRAKHKRPIVFLSLGASNSGLDFDIDVRNLPYDFITTGSLRLVGDNVTSLDSAVSDTQDYVKAADFCIAKAGWSTVAEMMISGNRFVVLNRDDVPEDTMIISELEKRGTAISIDVDELKNMAKVMEKIEGHEKSDKAYVNNYRRAADIISSRWLVNASEDIVNTDWVKVRKDAVTLQNGSSIDDFFVITIKEASCIVAIDTEGNIILKSEYRYTYGKELIEVPAGGIENGETDGIVVAKRELLEETGYVSDERSYLGPTVESSAKMTNYMHIYFANKCWKVAGQKLDDTEELSVMVVPLEEAVEMVMNNTICCNSSAHGILRVAKMLGK